MDVRSGSAASNTLHDRCWASAPLTPLLVRVRRFLEEFVLIILEDHFVAIFEFHVLFRRRVASSPGPHPRLGLHLTSPNHVTMKPLTGDAPVSRRLERLADPLLDGAKSKPPTPTLSLTSLPLLSSGTIA